MWDKSSIPENIDNILGRPTFVEKALSFTHELFFFFLSITRAAAAQCMAIKCIPKVRSKVKRQQLV